MSRDRLPVMTAERRKSCVVAPKTPHGEGHNAVCICMCRWCRAERAALGMPWKSDALVWDCPSCAWTNFDHDECGRCHAARAEPQPVAPSQGELFAEAA